MTRLGHISFFGLGLLNLCYGLTVAVANVEPASIDAILLIIGAVTMPLVCYLAAYRKAFRHLFAIPALSVTIAVLDIARRLSI